MDGYAATTDAKEAWSLSFLVSYSGNLEEANQGEKLPLASRNSMFVHTL